jgi:hypothetical protein
LGASAANVTGALTAKIVATATVRIIRFLIAAPLVA